MEKISLNEMLQYFRNSISRDWTEDQWRNALSEASREVAHDILRQTDLPRLKSFTNAGISTFIVVEADAAEISITVTAMRKTTNESNAVHDIPPFNPATDKLPERDDKSAHHSTGFGGKIPYYPPAREMRDEEKVSGTFTDTPGVMHNEEHGKAA